LFVGSADSIDSISSSFAVSVPLYAACNHSNRAFCQSIVCKFSDGHSYATTLSGFTSVSHVHVDQSATNSLFATISSTVVDVVSGATIDGNANILVIGHLLTFNTFPLYVPLTLDLFCFLQASACWDVIPPFNKGGLGGNPGDIAMSSASNSQYSKNSFLVFVTEYIYGSSVVGSLGILSNFSTLVNVVCQNVH
jgi:hypothetical protein